MPVNEILSANRAKLSGGEETGNRRLGQQLARDADVVAGLLKHPGAASIATEEQRAGSGTAGPLPIEKQSQIFIGGGGGADGEFDGLPRAEFAVSGACAGLLGVAPQVCEEAIAPA